MEIASFLARHAPFDAMERDRLDELAGRVKTEQFPAGTVVLQQSGEPSRFLYLVRHGSVEILDDGNLVDLIGEGEVFGAWSLLGGFSPTATVRAHEDATCYLIEPDDAREVLGTSQGMTFVVSSLKRGLVAISGDRDSTAADRYRAVGSLVRRSAVTCEAGTTVAEAAELMTREHLSSLLIPRDDGLGILTDRDLRTKVVAARGSLETPVGEVMTFPASAVSHDAMAGEVLLLMLDGGFHHAPVVDAIGKPIGVVTDTDLLGLGKHTPFALKSSIERAADRDSAVQAALGLPDVVCSLVDVRADPVDIGHIVGFTIDALTRRLISLAIERYGEPPVPWAWLALGSAARQEQALYTDQDHALAYDLQGRTREQVDPYFADFAEFVTAGLEDAGIPRCNGDAMAANSALRKSVEGWIDAYKAWMTDPGVEGSVLLSIVFDYRRVMGPLDAEGPLDELLRSCKLYPNFLRHLSRRALDEKPPTGFRKDLVVESKGQHAGRLDIKHKGTTIVGNLARAVSIGAGLTEKRTIGRLRASADAGTINEETRAELEEAFRFLWGVRLEHQVARVRAGESPDDFVDPSELGPVTRQALKEAFKHASVGKLCSGHAIFVRHVVFSDGELTPSIETEWQFDAVHLAPVQRWLGQHAEGTIRVEPAGTRSLVDRYLDTADLRIHRAQRSLRLRRIGRGAEITLKLHAPAVDGVRSREEITERVSVPDVAALGTDGEVAWRVRALIGRRQLGELFEVRTRRQVFLLQHGGLPVGEVVLDRTVIGIGPRLEPARLRRVEVEVADAAEPEIAAFVERLRQECGLQLAPHTKFEAGFLARGLEVPLPRDLGSTSFDLHSSTGELAFAVLRGHFVEMLAHESGTRLGEDPEELHGMRVATRRLRAVLGIFQPALPVRGSRFRADLGWLGQVLGAVRDLDVEIGQLRGATEEALGGEDIGALDALIGVLESRRSEARATLLEVLDARRYDRLVDGFAAFLAHGPLRRSAASAAPAAATVPAIAIERYRKVRKQGRRLDASSEPGEFHVLRIRCKRLRYTLEAVAELYGKPARVMNRRLIALQDVLGSHQDAIVASQRLRSLAIDDGHDLPPATVFAMGELTARYTDRAERLRSEFPPLFRKLAGPWKELRRVMEAAAPEIPSTRAQSGRSLSLGMWLAGTAWAG